MDKEKEESMESKSPKEIQVEEKITELVTKIVDYKDCGRPDIWR